MYRRKGYVSTRYAPGLSALPSRAVTCSTRLTSGSEYEVGVVFPYVTVMITLAAYLKDWDRSLLSLMRGLQGKGRTAWHARGASPDLPTDRGCNSARCAFGLAHTSRSSVVGAQRAASFRENPPVRDVCMAYVIGFGSKKARGEPREWREQSQSLPSAFWTT